MIQQTLRRDVDQQNFPRLFQNRRDSGEIFLVPGYRFLYAGNLLIPTTQRLVTSATVTTSDASGAFTHYRCAGTQTWTLDEPFDNSDGSLVVLGSASGGGWVNVTKPAAGRVTSISYQVRSPFSATIDVALVAFGLPVV